MTEEVSFEKAFERLDFILQQLNESKVSLDESLKLFEEANFLIKKCSSKLTDAESKIEMLIKDRNQDLVIENSQPQSQSFEPNKNNIF